MKSTNRFSIKNILGSAEIRSKILLSLIAVIAFRFLASVPVIGMTKDAMSELLSRYTSSDAVQVFSAGGLETASIIAIGIGPYISASIMLQLLGTVVPHLEELRKEGSQGQSKINMYTRIVAVPLAILQSFVVYATLQGLTNIPALTPIELAAFVASVTGGSMLIMWLAERIGENGLANGSSYLIFLGIIAGVITQVGDNLRNADLFEVLIFAVVSALIVLVTIAVSDAERRIRLLYSRRINTAGLQENYLPIKLTQFGVMPVIFASAFLSFPVYIGSFITASEKMSASVIEFTNNAMTYLNDPWIYNSATFILVLLFSFFYISVVFKTDEVAENLQRQGAFIPGIRPGPQTERYLKSTAYKLTAFGGLFLALLAVLPGVLTATGLLVSPVMSGTGILIAVGVALEIKRRVESMIVVRSYDKYL